MKHVFTLLLISFLPATLFPEGATVDYTVRGEAYSGYFTRPAGDAPLVLLLHDWDGLTDYEVKRADMLVEQGYTVFAADLFGKGVRPTKVEDKRQHTGELYRDREKMRELISGALEKAAELGADTESTVIMGYCFGGAAVLEAARANIPAKGYVTFHGGLSTPEGQNYADTEGEVLVFHGTADKLITLEDFANLAKELEDHDAPHEMITYGGAPHAFTVFGSDRYRKGADEKSWSRFLEFLSHVSPTSGN